MLLIYPYHSGLSHWVYNQQTQAASISTFRLTIIQFLLKISSHHGIVWWTFSISCIRDWYGQKSAVNIWTCPKGFAVLQGVGCTTLTQGWHFDERLYLVPYISGPLKAGFNSLLPQRHGCSIKLVIFIFINDRFLQHFQQNYSAECCKTSPMISQHCFRQWLGASRNKPLPESILTQIYVVIWHY